MRLRRRFPGVLAGAVAVLALGAVSALAAAASGGPKFPTRDPFYSYGGSLKQIAPGTVLRSRTVALPGAAGNGPRSATQVLYRTTGEQGQATVTVATIIRPTSPAGPIKILSYQTAYDALGAKCDPSYTLQGGNPSDSVSSAEEQVILGYVRAGDTVVVSDYEGEKLDWLAGQESGYGTLDGIRATERVLHAGASTPVAMIGYSGGSVATEFASQLAHAYAPKLNIVGVAEGGIPVDQFHNTAYVNGTSAWSGTIPASLVSLARSFRVKLKPYLSAYGRRIANQVKRECIASFYGAYPGLTYQKLLKHKYRDIFKIHPLVKIIDHLIMGRGPAPRGPLFIGVGNSDGIGDGVMVTKDDEALAHTYCKRGVSVDFNIYAGDDHTQAAVAFEEGAASFISARLANQPVTDNCSSVGAGNSLAPLPVR
jgi:Secretory lipase